MTDLSKEFSQDNQKILELYRDHSELSAKLQLNHIEEVRPLVDKWHKFALANPENKNLVQVATSLTNHINQINKEHIVSKTRAEKLQETLVNIGAVVEETKDDPVDNVIDFQAYRKLREKKLD